MMYAGKLDEDRLAVGFRRATARAPNPTEVRVLLKVYREALARFRADKGAATKLLGVGDSARDPKLDETDLAAWAIVASTILNLDETISRR